MFCLPLTDFPKSAGSKLIMAQKMRLSQQFTAAGALAGEVGPVLLVALSRGYGGADVRVFDLARSFHGRIPYAVAVLSHSPLQQKLAAAGLAARPLPYARSDPRLAWRLYQIIREEGFCVVDGHNPQSQLWGLLAGRLAGAPVLVSTVHHAYGLVENLRLRDRLYERVLRFNIRWGCRFVTVSQSIYDYLRQLGVPQSDLFLSYNAIDLEAAAARPPDFSWRQALGWGADTVVIINVGRLETQKGHKYLLQALRMAVQERPQLRCVLVGEGRLRPALERQIADLQLSDVVHLAGFRRDVAALLGSSDVFCLASLYEGLPYALLEAAAYRLPFVVTAVDGMAELLTDEQNALLVPPADPAALAAALVRLADDPEKRAALGQAGRELVRRRFAPEVMVAETLSVYGGQPAPLCYR